MDEALRQAWTEIVTAADYEQHMAAIGQAQAAAELTAHLLDCASLADASTVAVIGAGTGQMFEFLDGAVFRRYHLVCTDLNPSFLICLRGRLKRQGLEAEILEDDFEQSRLAGGVDFLLATLVLEHIDWRRGVGIVVALRPAYFAVILQENPAGMASAITPGRRLPPSIARAAETAHPVLVPREELIAMLGENGYACREIAARPVADGKSLTGLLFADSRG